MQQSYPGINPSISEWKGQEIADFQEELLIKVNAHLSGKWFYNHIKTENTSLPRIDILNLLAKYTGDTNWDNFVFKNGGAKLVSSKRTKANRYFILVPVLVLAVMAIFYLLFKLLGNREYNFSFYDAHTREPITGCRIEVRLISEGESEVNYFSDSSGFLRLKSDQSMVKMIASAPYYYPDTITRILKNFEPDQKISLQPNDYAMMIHYFSETKLDDWHNRRSKLDLALDEGAMIYQVLNSPKNIGMELYNKWEFIDKLTMPSGNLKHIEVLESKMKNEKIMVLRFRINDNNKDD
jgi:hypothetical protein